jgi:TolB-like protein/tetratricopeptide (TPR) repeat protein
MGANTANTPDVLLQSQPDAGSAGEPISPDAVREALSKISASGGFTATERSRKLLAYLVSETLAGRGGRIKAYCIGTVVFGRPESFDPQKDPIVRIEAARLRRDLEHYYLTDGSEDQVVIDIPKGGYVPRFHLRSPSAAAGTSEVPAAIAAAVIVRQSTGRLGKSASAILIAGLCLVFLGVFGFTRFTADRPQVARSAVQVPGLLVKPLEDITLNRNSAVLAQGLTERIIEKASRFRELAVIPGDSTASQTPASVARYEFGGTLRDDGGQLLVQTRLVDRMDGRVIWADSYTVALQPQQLFNVEQTIADQIATRIAEPSGIVFDAEGRMLLDAPSDSMDAYRCTLSAYAYRVTLAAGKFPAMRACLEQAVAEHADYATAWALLSLAYTDEFRFLYAPPEGNKLPALQRAFDAARRATELDPDSVRAQQALMMALFFRKEYAASIEVGKRALALNPNDLALKGEYGYRLALTGNWTDGCTLIEEARNGSARKVASLTTALALCHFYEGDVAGAATLVGQADAEENPAYHVIAAAILAEAGDTAAAATHREWLDRNKASQLSQLLLDLTQRLVRPADQQRFMEALRKAGFAVT